MLKLQAIYPALIIRPKTVSANLHILHINSA
jgi:hypothetical protein